MRPELSELEGWQERALDSLLDGFDERGGDIRVWGMIAPRPRSPFPATVCYILGTNSVVKTSDAGGDFKMRQGDSSSKAQEKLTAHSVGEEPQPELAFGLGNKVW